jgi:hypothetical protein
MSLGKEDRELHMRVGELGGLMVGISEDLRGLKTSIDRMEAKQEERDLYNAERRREMYDNIEKVSKEISDVKRVAEAAASAAASAQAVTDRVEDYEQRGKGLVLAIGIGGTGFGAALFWWFDAVISWLKVRMGL